MKLVLFDIDGTLIRGGRAGRRSLGFAFQETFALEDAESFMKQVAFNGRTDPIIVRDIARVAGIEAADLESRLESLFESYLRHLNEITRSSGAVLCPGLPGLLDRLKEYPGVTLGLLTGNIEAGARVKLNPFDLNRYFAEGGFGSDSEDRGTIAAIARRKFEVLAGHPIAPENVLVIGDTEHDVACGRVNGFRTLAVGTGGVPAETLRGASADLVMEDLGAVDEVIGAIGHLMAFAPR